MRETWTPFVSCTTPRSSCDLRGDWPEPGAFPGSGGRRAQVAPDLETWDADTVEPIGDFIDAGDRVVVRQVWRGIGEGPESNIETTQVTTVRKGRIVYQEFFWDHAEALEAAGLPE